MDAIVQLHITLNHKGAANGCWTPTSAAASITSPMNHCWHASRSSETVVRRWLKAGVVELGHYQETEEGTPQGGVISPLLANIALDGMERLFHCEWRSGTAQSSRRTDGTNRGISLVRYADDFVVTAPSREVLENYVRPKLEQFLAERGLALSEAKTRIVHIDEGFNFLGFHASGASRARC